MILIGALETGSANYLTKVIRNLDYPYKCYASRLSNEVFKKNGIQASISENYLVEGIKLVITGTILGDGLDKELINHARLNEIPSISIVEHWTNFKNRFIESNGKYIYPDYIFLNDLYAMKKAKMERLPEDKLVIVGNPVLEEIQKKDYSLKSSNINEHTLLFISEDLTKYGPSLDNRILGFNQFDVLSDILKFSEGNWNIKIKLHPSENEAMYSEYLANKQISIIDYEEMMQNVFDYELIIGMESMLLIELALMGIEIYSYRPSSIRKFIGCELGWIYDLRSSDLRKLLSNYKLTSSKLKVEISDFKGSTDRIINYINNIYEYNCIHTG